MGCTKSKDAHQPGSVPASQNATATKDPTPASSPEKKALSQAATPAKSPISVKGIKEIPADQLKKHKPADLIGFCKQGNLPMVHGLINYFGLHKAFVQVRGSTDEFTLKKGEPKVSMANWNPLLIAIANKKLEIVRYLQSAESGIAVTLTHAGSHPDNGDAEFSLQLAIANQDLPMLIELWSSAANYQYWTHQHLSWVISHLLTESPKVWQAGLNYLTKANPLSDAIFYALTFQ